MELKSVVLIDGPYLELALRQIGVRIDHAKLMTFLRDKYAPVLKTIYYTGIYPGGEKNELSWQL